MILKHLTLQIRPVLQRRFLSYKSLEDTHKLCTIRVDNIPHGYDVPRVLKSIKANPVERLVADKKCLIVRFLSYGMAMRCVEESNGVDGMALRLIGQISERSAFLVAAVGYGITRTCIVENIPPGVRSGNLKTLITQDKPMEYWNYDKKNLRAEMRFMDVYHAWLVRRSSVSHVAVYVFLYTGQRCCQPKFYPQSVSADLHRRRRLLYVSRVVCTAGNKPVICEPDRCHIQHPIGDV